MALDASSHKLRIITGLILAAAAVLCLILGGAWLRSFIAMASCIALFEFYCMFWGKDENLIAKATGLFLGAVMILFSGPGHASMVLLFVIVGAACFYAAISFLSDYGKGNDSAHLETHLIMPAGILYIPLAMQLAMHLTLTEQLIVILAAVGSDTGAYYAGSILGKRKLWPRVSPKKSWEGAIGGMLACILILALFACFVELPPALQNIPGWGWILMAISLNIASLVGDLFESAIKRALNVKDSGTLLPGHGGFLDRIDSLIFTMPVYALFRFFLFAPAAQSFTI